MPVGVACSENQEVPGCFQAATAITVGISRSIQKRFGMRVSKPPSEREFRKDVHPHTLQGTVSPRIFTEAGADLRMIQILLGHRDLEETTIYLHLSQRHLNATASPLDSLRLKYWSLQRENR